MKMDKKTAVKMLRQVKEVLDKHDVEFWLDYGTLLGAIRDNEFIPWDSDIDLGIWYKDFDKVNNACKELRNKRFMIHIYRECTFSIRKDQCLLSINFYHLVDDKAMTFWIILKNFWGKIIHCLDFASSIQSYDEISPNSLFTTKIMGRISLILPTIFVGHFTTIIQKLKKNIGSECITISVPSHYFMNLSTIRFYGMKFKVPAETEEYLAYRYGKGWKIPKKDYIFYEEDGAIAKNAGN
jgi:phosphorylcholine metabolism protein LicD